MVRVMPILNYSEKRVLRITDDALGAPKYRVFAKARLADVLVPDGDELSYHDQSFLIRAHFDFVVVDGKSQVPLFAIEFDGPHHKETIQITRDIRKNRLCHMAGFPLLRIGRTHLYEHDRATLLGFMLRRYEMWPTEHKRVMTDIEEYVSTLTKGEVASLTDGGVADPSIDPHFLVDIDHPFPGISLVSERMYARFGIVTDFSRRGNGALFCEVFISETWPYPQWTAKCAYVLYRSDGAPSVRFERGRFEVADGEKLHEGTTLFRMQWELPIAEDWQPDEAPLDYLSRTHELPYWHGDPPGIHVPDIVEWFVQYLALRQVEAWAERHLNPVRTS